MRLETDRLQLDLLQSNHAALLRDYHHKNKAHLAPWEPRRPESIGSIAYWDDWVANRMRQQEMKQAFSIVAVLKGEKDICAFCSFTNVVGGPFQACNLGYSVSIEYQGHGLMHETLKAALGFIFEEISLHRVMANYMPENQRSERLLTSLGFEKEGFAKSYLKINGAWRDHVLTSKINPNH